MLPRSINGMMGLDSASSPKSYSPSSLATKRSPCVSARSVILVELSPTAVPLAHPDAAMLPVPAFRLTWWAFVLSALTRLATTPCCQVDRWLAYQSVDVQVGVSAESRRTARRSRPSGHTTYR